MSSCNAIHIALQESTGIPAIRKNAHHASLRKKTARLALFNGTKNWDRIKMTQSQSVLYTYLQTCGIVRILLHINLK